MIVEHGKLSDIAARMQLFARLNSYTRGKPITSYRRALPHGLEITLLLDEQGEWYLEIARPNVMPSTQEEAIIKREFGVPESAERSARQNALADSAKQTRCAIRWRWKSQSPDEEEQCL